MLNKNVNEKIYQCHSGLDPGPIGDTEGGPEERGMSISEQSH